MKNLIIKTILPALIFVLLSYLLPSSIATFVLFPIAMVAYILICKNKKKEKVRFDIKLFVLLIVVGVLLSKIPKVEAIEISAITVLAVCILGPISEELIFRGICFNGTKITGLISSLLFAAAHTVSIETFLVTFIMGLALCFNIYKTKDIKINILAHMLINTIILLWR